MLMSEQELVNQINKHDRTIIFGAGLCGVSLIKYLGEIGEDKSIFCVGVSDTNRNPSNILGIPVCPMEDLKEYTKNSLVIIAAFENLHEKMMETLTIFGFVNIVTISNVCYAQIRKKNLNLSTDIWSDVRRTFNYLVETNEGLRQCFQYQYDQLSCIIAQMQQGVQEIQYMKQLQMNEYNLMQLHFQEQNEITATQMETFGKYRNCHLGKDIVIVATGPTLNRYHPLKDAIHIGVNAAFNFQSVELDYLFIQDVAKSSFFDIEKLVQLNCKKFIGKFLADCPHKKIELAEGMFLRANASRYYADTAPSKKIYTDIRFHPLMDFYSIVFPAIHFALFTNPRRIYLVGCDVSESGHFDNTSNKGPIMEGGMENWMHGYSEVKKFAAENYPETEIISINPVGLKGVFKDIYL